MHTFNFELTIRSPEGFNGDDDDSFGDLSEKVYAATDPHNKGSDATICMSNGQLSVMFSREADSRDEAVTSARTQLGTIGLEVTGEGDFTL